MSDQAKLKEQLKKTIRALVISAPLGLTPKELERDFGDFEGRPLPYRQLGYNTCQDFLQDIPDTVRAQWERGQLIVRAVADESTRHIQSLVSRQKVDVVKCLKKRRATACARSFGVSVAVAKSLNVRVSSASVSRPWRPGGSAGKTRTATPDIALSSQPRPRGPPAVPPTVPAYVRNQIKSFLIDHPNGIQNTHFDMLFAEKFGHTICCNKLGFESLRHMCQALSDFVSVEKISGGEFRIYERSNYHHVESRSENKPSSDRPAEVNNVKRMSKVHVNAYSSISADATNNFKQDKSFKQGTASNNTSHIQPTPQSPQRDQFRNSTRRPDIQTEQRRAPDTRSGIPSSLSESTGSANEANSPASANCLTSDVFETKFLEEIQQILAQEPNGLWAAYLSDVYKKQFKKALPMMSLGYFSVTELMAAMPEVVAIEREQKQGDWKLYDIRTYKPKTNESAKPSTISSTKSTEMQVTPDPSQGFLHLKKKVRQLLENYPEGVLLKNLPLYYQRKFCEMFPVEELGFRDVESLIMMMPDTVTVVYKGYGRLLVVLVDESSMLPRKSIPADAVGWGFSYTDPDFPPVGVYIEVYVATVFTPHRLCIQLKDKQRNDDLDEIMDNLESVYGYPEGNKYEFPESMIAVGQVCCALYLSDNNWHRGLITGIPKVDFLEVLYVDYGTVATVSRSSLRLLKSSFLRLPIQSYNARLAFIEPAEDKWTKESRDRLLAMTAGKPLIAKVIEIQRDELYLDLSDTTTDEDVHVNDVLQEEGLARFAKTREEEDQLLSPPTRFGHFSEDELSDSELDLLTLNDLVVTKTGEAGDDDDSDQEESAKTDREQHEVAPSEVDNKTEPPLLETGSNPPFDSQESKSSDMPQLEATLDDGSWIVKRIDLDDGYEVHLINHDSEVCLTMAELAELLCGEDSEPEEFLCQQVSALGVDIPLLSATENEYPKLFQELRRVELLDNSENGPELLTMIPFTSALLLLSSCCTVSMDTLQQLQEIAEELGVFGDIIGSDVSVTALDELELSLELEDLSMTLEALQFKRKRILGSMMQNTDANFVDELSYIERKIQKISKRVEQTKATMQQQEVTADKMASVTSANTAASSGQSDRPQENIQTNHSETVGGAPDRPNAPGSPKCPDGNIKSPGRLIQAVEPLPRDDDKSGMASQQEMHPTPHAQQPKQAGHTPCQTQSAIGQSQWQYQPPTNQEAQFTQPSPQFATNQNHYATFPNPRFPIPHAAHYFPAQPNTHFAPLDSQYPLIRAAYHGYQQHLGSGDFVPVQHPLSTPNWAAPPPQGPFVDQFSPHPTPIPHLTPIPLGHPPRPFMVNPQGYCQGEPGMPGQGPAGQGSWW